MIGTGEKVGHETPQERMPDPVSIKGGQYLDFGIRNNLKLIELRPTYPNSLNFSWDAKCLCPLVMKVEELKDIEVLLVGVYIGDSNPLNPNEYFYCFNK